MDSVVTFSLPIEQAFDQSVKIQGVVAECADQLTEVNAALHQGLGNADLKGKVEEVLEQCAGVENKVQHCVDDLSRMSQALEHEVHQRAVLERELLHLRGTEEVARREALHDPLTSLPNRLLFNDRLTHGLAQAKRHHLTLAVMFMDVDNFKAINDTHGHQAGDRVLQSVAERLVSITREDDTVSRHGGDEFLYLLMQISDHNDAEKIAQKILKDVGRPCEVGEAGRSINLSIQVSIGIAVFPNDGSTADDLIESADQAMYLAKRSRIGYAFRSAST